MSSSHYYVADAVRPVLFLVGCLGTRALLALLAWWGGPRTRRALAALYTVIATGLLVHFVFGTRPTAPEAGGRVWWNHARPWHAALHLLFAVHVAAGARHGTGAWRYLAADVVLGLAVWLAHRVVG
jgi:hypothetical protein